MNGLMSVNLLESFDLQTTLLRMSFGRKTRRDLYAQLASFVAEGLPPYRTIRRVNEIAKERLEVRGGVVGALDRIANIASGQRRQLASRTRVLDAVLARMAQGKNLADSLRQWIPHEEAEMLRTGESADRLEQTLLELEHLLRVKLDIATLLRKAALGALARLGVLVAMMFYILSTVLKEARNLVSDELFAEMTLAPLYFRLGELFLQWFVPLVGVLAASSVAVALSLPRWRPSGLRLYLDTYVPPWNLYSRVQSATLLTSASAMMESGRQFRESLVGLSHQGTPWLRQHCRKMLGRLERGRSDAEALQTGMLPWELEDRLAVYAMLADFKQVMRAVARDSLEMVIRNVTAIGALMNLFAMLALGGFLILTIFAVGEIALEAQSAIGSATPKT